MEQLPSQVYWARLLLSNILAGNGETKYQHSNGPVWWGPYDNEKYYVSITDCSGFINALLKKSYHLSSNDFLIWFGTTRAYASTYYRLIDEQNGFTKITNIYHARIGDFIVFRFPPGTSKKDDTGHIVMINNRPIQISPISPSVPGLLQWRVGIIDQTSSPHGSYDTRYLNGTTGLGSGEIRIYTDIKGNLRGYAWSLNSNSKYVNSSYHPIVIGRILTSLKN